MRILRLHPDDPSDYCCNIYWVLGSGEGRGSRNSLVDAGSSRRGNWDLLAGEMQNTSKGIGAPAVEQVVITHWHYDHVGGLPAVIERFQPRVLAFRREPYVDRTLYDGSWVRLGDGEFRVLHTPGHSDDSICLFCPETGDLFTGDTLYRISDATGTYPECYLQSLDRLRALGARSIYPGHGLPILENVEAFLDDVLANVRASSRPL